MNPGCDPNCAAAAAIGVASAGKTNTAL